jgi:uncharacterized protein YkwD
VKPLRALPVCLAALAIAGCGSDGAPEPVSQAATATASVDAGVTEGRTGDATFRSADGAAQRLARQRSIDPGAAGPTPRQRDGVGAGAACADVEAMPVAGNLAIVEAATLCLLNGERADRGLAALTLNAQLAQAALGHARDMVEQGYFSHDSADGRSMTDRVRATGYIPKDASWIVGENLAWGSGALATPRAIANAWMNSEGHRENILNGRFREIGFGIVLGTPKSPDTGATYANEFGARGDGGGGAAGAGEPEAAAPPSSAPTTARKIPSRRALSQRRRACGKLAPRRARACRARVARKARAAQRARAARRATR